MKVGDIVAPIPDSGYYLRSGAEWYPDAVVICTDPLVLVSRETDMRWESTVQADKLVVVGEASEVMLARCMSRLPLGY